MNKPTTYVLETPSYVAVNILTTLIICIVYYSYTEGEVTSYICGRNAIAIL